MKPHHILSGLALLLIASVGSLWAERRYGKNFEFSSRAHHWVQPQTVSAQFPNPITPNEWTFTYEPFEERLLSLQQDYVWSSSSLPLLDELVHLLPQTLSLEEWDRLRFLIQKSLPGARRTELADLMPKYQRYRAALDHQLEQPQTGTAVAATQERFLRTLENRLQYLGAHWHQRLFAQQEATAMQLLNRLQARYEQSRNADTASTH